MNTEESKSLDTKAKSYQCPQGPLAWLNDIEITKTPYLASILLLIVNIILVRQSFFSIDIPYMGSMKYALHDVSEFSGLSFAAMILGFVSVFCLLVPLIKFFEWKYMWFIPTAATGLIETIVAFYLIAKKNELLENTLIGYAYELLSIELNLTATAWLLIAVNIVIIALSIKMFIDLKDNERKY